MSIDYKRALIRHALGTEAERLIALCTEDFGDEPFAIQYIHAIVKRWIEREMAHDAAQVAQLSGLVCALSNRAATYEAELRAIHEAEERDARRKGWK